MNIYRSRGNNVLIRRVRQSGTRASIKLTFAHSWGRGQSGRHHINMMRSHWYHSCMRHTWWRHQMDAFSELLAICAGNSPVPAEFPPHRPVTRSFDVFFDLRPNKRLSKQWWRWWFEKPLRPLWRHFNDTARQLTDKAQSTALLTIPNSCSFFFYQ